MSYEWLCANKDKLRCLSPRKRPPVESRPMEVEELSLIQLRELIEDVEKMGRCEEEDVECTTLALVDTTRSPKYVGVYNSAIKILRDTQRFKQCKRRKCEDDDSIFNLKHKLVLRILNNASVLFKGSVDEERMQTFVSMLDALAAEASALFDIFMEGYNKDLKPLNNTSTEFKVDPLATNAAFLDYDPGKVSYRVFCTPEGHRVDAFVQECMLDFFKPCSNRQRKPNPLWDDEFYAREIPALATGRDAATKRGTSRVGESTRSAKREEFGDRRRRHAMAGPLQHHEYKVIQELIARGIAGDAVAQAEVVRKHPSYSWHTIVRQHEVELRLMQLGRDVADFIIEYSREETIFAGDFVARAALFGISGLPWNMRSSIESENRPERWFLRFLHLAIQTHEPCLKTRNYIPVERTRDDSSMRRWRNGKTVEESFEDLYSRLSSITEAIVAREVFTLYRIRFAAFKHSGKLDAEWQNLSKDKHERDLMEKKLFFNKNDAELYKDWVIQMAKEDETRDDAPPEDAIPVGSLRCNIAGSLSEIDCLMQDAMLLSVVALGRTETIRLHSDLLSEAKMNDLPTQQPKNILVSAAAMEERDTSKRSRSLGTSYRVLQGEFTMGDWLPLTTRVPLEEAKRHVAETREMLQKAIEFGDSAISITVRVKQIFSEKLSHAYDRVEKINKMDFVEPGSDDYVLQQISRNNGTVLANKCMVSAIEAYREQSTPSESMRVPLDCLKEIVGKSVHRWNWDKGSPLSSRLGILKQLMEVVERYETYTCSLTCPTTIQAILPDVKTFVQTYTKLKRGFKKDGDEYEFAFDSPPNHTEDVFKNKAVGISTWIDALLGAPTTFNQNVASVVRGAFLHALEWSGCLFQRGADSYLVKPRLDIGIRCIVQYLSIAVAFGILCLCDTREEHEDALRSGKVLFSVLKHERIDMPDVEMLLSPELWNALCCCAEAGKATLYYNREIVFAPSDVVYDPDGALVSFDRRDFVVVHKARVRQWDSPQSYADRYFPLWRSFPKELSWTLCDVEMCTPDRFVTLLTFFPDVAHSTDGVFRIPGVRDKPSINNGFLNALSLATGWDKKAQFFETLYKHRFTRTDDKVPAALAGSSTDPAITPMQDITLACARCGDSPGR